MSGLPPDPSTAAVLGLIVLFYVVGNVIQGASVVWESWYWALAGGWPSTRRITPGDAEAYDEPFRALIRSKLDEVVGSPTTALQPADAFGLARAVLRKQGQDARAESFNAIYGLNRGLVTAGAIILVVLLVSAMIGDEAERNLIAAAIVGASLAFVLIRFRRFSFYFADQVWRDFVALA